MICILRGLSLFPVIYLVDKFLGLWYMMVTTSREWCWIGVGQLPFREGSHIPTFWEKENHLQKCRYVGSLKGNSHHPDFFTFLGRKIIGPKLNLHFATIASCPTCLIRSDHLKVSDRHGLDEFSLRSLQMITPAQNRSK